LQVGFRRYVRLGSAAGFGRSDNGFHQVRRTDLRSRARHAVAVAAIAAVLAGVGSGALAAPAWATKSPVIPSQSQVDQANAATLAKGVQIGQTEAALAAASASLTKLNNAAESAVEAYDGAMVNLQTAQAAAGVARAAANAATVAWQAASRQLQMLAAASYRGQSQFATLAALFSAKSPDTYESQSAELSAVSRQQQGIIDTAASAAQKRATAQAASVSAVAKQTAASNSAIAAKNAAIKAMNGQAAQVQQIKSSQFELQAQLAVLKGTAANITQARQAGLAEQAAEQRAAAAAAAAAAKRQAELLREAKQAEQAREAAAAAAAAAAAQRAQAARDAAAQNAENSTSDSSNGSSGSSGSGSGSSSGSGSGSGSSGSGATQVDVVTPGSGTSVSTAAQRAIAVAFAESQIGVWYRWAGAGEVGPTQTASGIQNVPGYDCSGLTMKAYAAAGISLAHFTGDQWNEGMHVSQSQLVPGDLLFFATNIDDPSTIHHVGIYIGNGQMVDAPETGEQIGIHNAFTGEYIGAVQP
jgi:cell wall-associated NlpC family hydrolase